MKRERDPYLYEDCDVLKNKFDIKDNEQLEQAEQNIMTLVMPQIDNFTQSDKFDYNRLKEINLRIFESIYDWAGIERIIPMAKGERIFGGDTVRYSHPHNIKTDAGKVIKRLNSTDWQNLTNQEKVKQFSKHIAALWQAHPFREGNTRTIMTFACQFADEHGFPLNRELFATNANHLRDCLAKASDGQYSEYEYLEKIINRAIETEIDLQKIMKLSSST